MRTMTLVELAVINTGPQIAMQTRPNTVSTAIMTTTQAGVENARNSRDASRYSMTTTQRTGCRITQPKHPGLRSPTPQEKNHPPLQLAPNPPPKHATSPSPN